ncbi:sugar phosphate isomerase/epimerase [Geobacter sp. FeAm09]|uniref:sugar phosphate isomerase/epimerase family protein n=1 Tax=Geobacter sp. FeAm09 TaxID=2597769 RepID=UPI0011EDD56A|nr:sugar phosphate isomerase/epimerase family protein [Geobacter sp. FeAm09]QEM67151.1 sugar phosphate isomerase/epimerase [Geobacter sp. FeAm09]
MKNRIHAHVPYPQLPEYLPYLVERHINPEIYLPAEALDRMAWEELAVQAHAIHTAGLAVTIHSPFMDLSPGALDAGIREATRRRFHQVFKAAELLRPRVIVVHPGFDDLHYGDNRLAWLGNSIEFWREFIPCARELDTVLAVENIFEKEPSTLRALLEGIDDPRFRHCFDVGHWNMFTTVRMEEWFAELGPYIAESHIHDNHGQTDEHLPPGEGEIDLDLFFGLLKHYAPDAAWTIEAHSIEHLQRALKTIPNYL